MTLTPLQTALVSLAQEIGYGAAIRLIRKHQRQRANEQQDTEPTEDDMRWAEQIEEIEGAA